MSTPRLVLASGSPRRRKLLEEAGYRFDVATPWVNERAEPDHYPAQVAVDLAVRKARAAEAPADAWIVAADTLLDLDGEVLGKPVDVADAVRTLRRLSGRAHWVITGVCVRRSGGEWTGLAQTKVTFRELTNDEIAKYVATEEPMDKAGAYAIQGGGKTFVARVDGPWDNVVGLPMDTVRALLRESRFPLA